jgi:hypothetical protein
MHQPRCLPVAYRDAQYARQRSEERAPHASAASEIAAHEARHRAASTMTYLDHVLGRIRTAQVFGFQGREVQVASD